MTFNPPGSRAMPLQLLLWLLPPPWLLLLWLLLLSP